MTYLFLGNKSEIKTRRIKEIKALYLKSSEALHFDFELLYADKLDKDDLKKALIGLPVVAPKRIVLVHTIEKLNKDHQRIITEYMEGDNAPAILILDSDRADLKNAFMTKLKNKAEVHICDEGDNRNAFDMTRDIQRNDSVNALKTLAHLIGKGEQPVRLLGALVWFWGQMKNKVSRQIFHRGLQCLQEADLNIKRSRLDPVYSLEKCVVSLSSLLL